MGTLERQVNAEKALMSVFVWESMRKSLITEDELALSQKQLVEALAHLYGMGTVGSRSRILSRFKSLLKSDLPSGTRPKHGKKERYTLNQVCEVFICFDLARNFGIDAKTIVTANANHVFDTSTWSSVLSQLLLDQLNDQKHEDNMVLKFRINHFADDGVLIHFEQCAWANDIAYLEGSGCILNLSLIAMILAARLPLPETRRRQGSRP